ncbi:MAG: hypothetical protein AAF701_01185 [Pseudomonadota bacterium]
MTTLEWLSLAGTTASIIGLGVSVIGLLLLFYKNLFGTAKTRSFEKDIK